MTYLRTHNNGISVHKRIIIALVIFLVIVFGAIYYFRPHLIPAIFTSLARPFWRAQVSVGMGSLTSPTNLLLENEELKRQIESAEVRLSTISAVEAENVELKKAMGRASTTPFTLAVVLKRPPHAPYDELIIDAGEDLGITAGDLVYAGGSVLIGKVAEVFDQTSKVLLFSSPDQKYEVEIGHGRVLATAIGKGGGQYEAELPRDINVREGDMVVVPSISTKTFGVVASVIADPARPFQTILFAPPINIYGLHWVWVDINQKIR